MTSEFFISTDPALLQIDFVVQSLRSTYWANQRAPEVIRASLLNSLCFGVYSSHEHTQVGFARVISDKATFSWLCDVVIDPDFRRRGLGQALVSAVLNHPELKHTGFRLCTADAHGLYERYGFTRNEVLRRPVNVPGPPAIQSESVNVVE